MYIFAIAFAWAGLETWTLYQHLRQINSQVKITVDTNDYHLFISLSQCELISLTEPKYTNIQHWFSKMIKALSVFERLQSINIPLFPHPNTQTHFVPPSLPVNEWFICLNCCQWFMRSCDHNLTACDKYSLEIKPCIANRNTQTLAWYLQS